MLILRLWNYIIGYVIINVEGYFLEKFINICTHRNIRLWNVQWQKNSRVSMRLTVDKFRQLRPIARKTHCRVHIIRKKGLPFVLERYKNRKAFIIGAGICILIFFTISSFVWDISINGNVNVPTEAIMEKLNENGVKLGALKYNINTDRVADNMMLEINELARINVSLYGTRIYVTVNERVAPPELVKSDIPCDIVAARDGVIHSVVAKEGLETVKIGDTVVKGQMLITGTIVPKNPEAPPLLVHSLGSVKARTWYEASAGVEQIIVNAKRTGMQKDQYSIVLFTKKIKLFHKKVPYTNSEHIELKKRLTLGKNFALPVEWIVDQYYEYKLEQNKVDMNTARKIASDKAVELAQKQIPRNAEIVKKSIVEQEDGKGGKKVKAIVECIEDIGVTREIGGM